MSDDTWIDSADWVRWLRGGNTPRTPKATPLNGNPGPNISGLDKIWHAVDQLEGDSQRPYGDPESYEFYGIVLYSQQYTKEELRDRVSESVFKNISRSSTETYYEIHVNVPEITGVLPIVDIAKLQAYWSDFTGKTKKLKKEDCSEFNKLLKRAKMYPTFYASDADITQPTMGSLCKVQFADGNNMCFGYYRGTENQDLN